MYALLSFTEYTSLSIIYSVKLSLVYSANGHIVVSFSRLFPPPFDWLRETPACLVHPGSKVLIPSEVIVLLMEVMSRHLFSKLQVWSWIASDWWMKKRELRDCSRLRETGENQSLSPQGSCGNSIASPRQSFVDSFGEGARGLARGET